MANFVTCTETDTGKSVLINVDLVFMIVIGGWRFMDSVFRNRCHGSGQGVSRASH